MSDQKYVPANVFLRCDKGVAPCQLQIVRPGPDLYDEKWAVEGDALPMVNVTTFGVYAITHSPCVPATVRWQNTLMGALQIDAGGLPQNPLLDNSFLPCTLGGKIDIFFTRAAVTQALQATADAQQVAAAKAVSERAKLGSMLLFGAAILVAVVVVAATGGAALAPLLVLAGEAALTGAAVGATVGTVAGGLEGYAHGGVQGALEGAGKGLVLGGLAGGLGAGAAVVGGGAGLFLAASAGAFAVASAADAFTFYKQPTLANGLVLLGDIVVLAGGRVAHELVKGGLEPRYESANTKPRGMPLSPDEVNAKFGRDGVELVEKTTSEAHRIGATQSKAQRGPVLSAVKDPLTGEIHYGQNRTSVPEDLHPLLKSRVKAYDTQLKAGKVNASEVDLAKAGEPGTHSEVMALCKLPLKVRQSKPEVRQLVETQWGLRS